MEMIERRKWIEKRMGVVFSPIYRGHEFNDRFGVFDHMAVAIDDCLTIEWHKGSSCYFLPQYVTKP
jgi:hypothetical protein